MSAQVRDAEDRDHALAAAALDENRPTWPTAADRLRRDLKHLLAFYNYPSPRWVHVKTSKATESTLRGREA